MTDFTIRDRLGDGQRMSPELLIVAMAAPWHWGRDPWEFDEDLAREIGRERIDVYPFEYDPDLVDQLLLNLGIDPGGDIRAGDIKLLHRDQIAARRVLSAHVRAALYDALDEVLGERNDIVPFQFGDRAYWVTGGKSSIGAPTAAYEPIAALNAIRLFERPLPHPEYR